MNSVLARIGNEKHRMGHPDMDPINSLPEVVNQESAYGK